MAQSQATGFKKATKADSKLRMAIFGPAGSGKTFTALSIAKGLGNRTALIDTERGSASKYASTFKFDVAELEDNTISSYVTMIGNANGHYDSLIIDSLSHGWKELLEQVDRIAKAKYRGNKWSAWSEGTPLQDKLVNAILGFKGHVIATMRSKTEWTTEKDERTGKTRPVRIGLSPEQGKGIEYEFDLLMEINPEHFGHIIKDRSGEFQDKIIEKPGVKFGEEIISWLQDCPKKTEVIQNKESTDYSVYKMKNGSYIGKTVSQIDDTEYLKAVIDHEQSPKDLKNICNERLGELLQDETITAQ